MIGLAELGHQVTVITRADNRRAIERNSSSRCNAVLFLYYDLPRWVQRIRHHRGGKSIYYLLWQWFAYRHLKRMYPAPPFDAVQHVSYVSIRYPSFMGGLGIPFVFGPVSGGERAPIHLRRSFSWRGRLREYLRDISNALVKFDPLMRRTFRQAARILVTPDTRALVPEQYQSKCVTRLAIALPQTYLDSAKPASRFMGPTLSLLYIGRLLDWKGLDLALHAVARLELLHRRVRFTIVGDGPAKPELMRLCRRLGIEDHVRWLPWIPFREVAQQYRSADLLLYPSLRDSGGMVVLEALAHGVPVVCTDLGGPGQIVDQSCGFVVPAHQRYSMEVASALADAIERIADSPHLYASLSRGARARALKFNVRDLAYAVHGIASPQRLTREA